MEVFIRWSAAHALQGWKHLGKLKSFHLNLQIFINSWGLPSFSKPFITLARIGDSLKPCQECPCVRCAVDLPSCSSSSSCWCTGTVIGGRVRSAGFDSCWKVGAGWLAVHYCSQFSLSWGLVQHQSLVSRFGRTQFFNNAGHPSSIDFQNLWVVLLFLAHLVIQNYCALRPYPTVIYVHQFVRKVPIQSEIFSVLLPLLRWLQLALGQSVPYLRALY